ncbi:MAG TPA: EamA family transporter [Terriglobales bacterium]|jgi:drug/metabolite transporter (DMT)-like permease|nr:EamA family transporter [Terriglobales bacterium]
MNSLGIIATWLIILVLVGLNSAGDMSTARAMRRVGDFAALRRKAGTFAVVRAVLTEPWFYLGLLAMALSFFALLAALSLIDLSLVVPASASLTFLLNLLGAKFFLKEHVSRRRWLSGILVLGGIVLLRT